MTGFLISLDQKLFLFLNSFNSPFWDYIMWYVSYKYTWIPFYLTILFFLFRKFKWKGFIPLIFILVAVTISDQVSAHVLKDAFARLRPCHEPAISQFVHIVRNKCGGQYGFVSSHASNAFAFGIFISVIFKKKWCAILMIVWALLVSYSRIYLGVHYPADVIAGAVLGTVIAFILYGIYSLMMNRFNKGKNVGLKP